MPIDPKLFKELIEIFKAELAEKSLIIANDLVLLENGFSDDVERRRTLENVFRCAHNLKGASRGLGIANIGEIAHQLEALFTTIIDQESSVDHTVIDLCLEAVDKMNAALEAFINNKPLDFDLEALLKKLSSISNEPVDKNTQTLQPATKAAIITPPSVKAHKSPIAEGDYVRVQNAQIEILSSAIEEMQVSKLEMVVHYSELNKLKSVIDQYLWEWKKIKRKSNSDNNTNTLNDYMTDITNKINTIQHEFATKINDLSTISNKLQDEIVTLRLVPASVLLSTLPRYVRDLGNELHKEVDIEVKGEDVRMDKLVLDGLKDPINHLIRNALDHGIEEQSVRLSANKPARGHIVIEFMDMGSEIIITISDDGAGINTSVIAKVAEEKKLFTHNELQSMSEAEIIDIIFMPGFSTKQMVTNISGRGVGMDVVKSNLVGLKGRITIKSIIGGGTIFTLHVPLTLSSERGLIVKCSDQQYVFPTNYIKCVKILSIADLIDIAGGQAILIDGHPVPFCSLSGVLAIESLDGENNNMPTVVVSNMKHTIAFLVNKIIGEREIIIKSIQEPLKKVKFVSGATLLDHNQLALVINVDDLITQSVNVKHNIKIKDNDIKNEKESNIHILVVDDSITTRTLEKNVLENKNYKVTTAVNGKEAWDLLHKEKFSLMITDIDMPVMDGLTLTERVKNDDKLRQLPIIIVTALGSESQKARGVEVGADAYVVKSEFESGALLDIIAQLV